MDLAQFHRHLIHQGIRDVHPRATVVIARARRARVADLARAALALKWYSTNYYTYRVGGQGGLRTFEFHAYYIINHCIIAIWGLR